ncbi:MAG: ATP-binding cassette domain-containing protein [Actinomycetota bacterium]
MLGRQSATHQSTPNQSTTHQTAETGPGHRSPGSITLDQVDAHRGRRLALRDVSFAVQPGTLTAVIGPNGAGKSTLFGILSGRLRATSGTVDAEGAVAEVLQTTDLDEQLRLTVDDVVRIGRYPARGLLRPMRADDRTIVREALAATDMLPLRRRPIGELSGGQRQRALIAQGLAQRAPILLLDEPTAGLDRRSQRQVMAIMRAEAERGTTIMFATHDLDQIDQADNLIVLACDCLCCAPPPIALADPAVTGLFGPAPRLTWNNGGGNAESPVGTTSATS